MTMFKSIISGIDLGPDTEKVISYAAYVALKSHSEVRLLYVIDYLMTPPSYLTTYIDEEKSREEAEMADWTTRLISAGVKADAQVVMGRLHESFVQVIGERLPELLVIGYQSHIIRPSSSERLIRSLKIPVLVVRGKFTAGTVLGSVRIRNILCPVDFSENSAHAVSASRELASLFSSDLHLVYIMPTHFIMEKKAFWKRIAEDDREKFDMAMRSDAGSQMGSFCREQGIDKGGEIFHGDPAQMISYIAEERGYDLIVMGAKGLSYLQTTFIGSTSEAVLKSSPCPVLLVH